MHKRSRGASPKASKRELDALDQFFQTLRGGYVNGIYQSALERRRLAERTAKDGSTKSLNSLNLTPEERDRLPSIFRKKFLEPYMGRHQGYTPTPSSVPYGMSMQHMQWARPSPLTSTVDSHNSEVNQLLKPSMLSHLNLKPSPLYRSKENEKGKS